MTTALPVLLAGQIAHAATPQKSSKAKTSAPATPAPKKAGISRNPYIGAIVVDAATGKVLAEDRADGKGYPASMLKLMDLLIILEKIERKELSLQDQVPVSAKAAATGGSQVWLAHNEVFSVEDMLFALMIQSANDVAVALAEKVAGSTEAFVALMNAKAKELGMTSTVFNSPHGLPPASGQAYDVSTPRDFAILCREILKHPEALRYTSARERTFRPDQGKKTVVMRSHNHLLRNVKGCDGLKTGYFYLAGYSVAATAERNGRRVVAVVMGSTDRLVRDAKAAELIEKGFAALPLSPASAQPGQLPAKAGS